MQNFKNNILKYNIPEILIIILTVCAVTIFFSNQSFQILSDRGREIILSQGILNGSVPFRDILLLYSPLAYYVNAVFLFVFGSSVNSLIIAAFLNSCIFALTYFLLAREFMSKKMSLLITLTVIFGCISSCTIFKYLFPYSFSMVYGLTATLLATFLLVKFHQNRNYKLLYFASFFAGLAFAFKLEFLIIFVLFCGMIFFSKKIIIKNKILSMIALVLSPCVTVLLPIIQGAKINDYIHYLNFFLNFSSTDSMKNFYIDMGTVFSFSNIPFYINGICGAIFVFSMTLVTFFLYNKFQNKIILFISSIFIFYTMFVYLKPYNHTILLPFTVLFLFILKFKETKKNPSEQIVIITSLVLCERCFFLMKMNIHGVYALPLLLIALYILIEKISFRNKFINLFNKEKVFTYIVMLYLAFFIIMNIIAVYCCNVRINTLKGNIYLPFEQAEILNKTINYIKSETKNTDKILILPEGHIINFLTERTCDLKLHMLDRLYYDGLGANKSLELLKTSNNDYIVIARGFSLSTFGKQFLYEEKNEITEYITKNYTQVKYFGNQKHKIFILKKID